MRNLMTVAAAALLLTGCGEGGWFGSTPKPPLPGTRVSVLSGSDAISADPRLAEFPVAIPQAITNGDWAVTGGTAERTLGHLALASEPRQAWSTSIGSGSSGTRRILASPVAGDGRIYTMDSDMRVRAFAADSGRELWSVDPAPEDEEDGFGGGIAFDAGRVYVAAGFAQIVTLDAATGKIVWRRSVAGPVRSAPLVADGRIYTTTVDNRTEALDAQSGDTVWSYTGTAEPTSILGGGTPGFSQDIVVAPYSSGEVVALRADNGRPLWTDSLAGLRRGSALAALSDVRGSPVIADGRVFAASVSGRIAAIDLRTGNRAWDGEFGGPSPIWFAGDYLFLISKDGELICVRALDGAIRWVSPLPRLADPDEKSSVIQWVGPVLAGDHLIVAGSHERALLISPYDGSRQGEIRLQDKAFLQPIVVNRTMYILTDDGRLTAYR
jgi:outer membrane protein assembly factor BamB